MSITYIPLPLRRQVIARAQNCCEYCYMPDEATLAPHEPDHVIGEQHGGKTELDNLAFACFRCNRRKGSNIATIDPQTGLLTPIVNPRTDNWSDHFRLNQTVIEPVTSVGRGTASLLRFNDEQRVMLRAALIQQGRYQAPSP
ncbi:MAG: HNH endonuclease [Ktedonobacterales bacterium]